MSSQKMLMWQYDQIMGQLDLLAGHYNDPDCPCTLGEHGEYCTPKHLLDIYTLCMETRLMVEDARVAEMIDDIGQDAKKYRDAWIERMHGKGAKIPDLAKWARDKRKPIELLRYEPKPEARALVHQGKAGMLQEKPTQAVRIAGKCDDQAKRCKFKLSRIPETRVATSIDEMIKTVTELSKVKEPSAPAPQAAKHEVKPLTVELSGRVYEFAPETVDQMVHVANETRTRELGFLLCKDPVTDLLTPSQKCAGGNCSISFGKAGAHCPEGTIRQGDFHTHPMANLNPAWQGAAEKTHSSADLVDNVRHGPGYIGCVSGPDANSITCAVAKPGITHLAARRGRGFPYIHPDMPSEAKKMIRDQQARHPSGGYYEPRVGAKFNYAEIMK